MTEPQSNIILEQPRVDNDRLVLSYVRGFVTSAVAILSQVLDSYEDTVLQARPMFVVRSKSEPAVTVAFSRRSDDPKLLTLKADSSQEALLLRAELEQQLVVSPMLAKRGMSVNEVKALIPDSVTSPVEDTVEIPL